MARQNYHLDIMYYSRGETRIEFKRGADGRFWLKVNDQPPTPLAPRELGDFLFHWCNFYRDSGRIPEPYFIPGRYEEIEDGIRH